MIIGQPHSGCRNPLADVAVCARSRAHIELLPSGLPALPGVATRCVAPLGIREPIK